MSVEVSGGGEIPYGGKLVLFVCVENAGRSQMAEGFGKNLGLACFSAGTKPASNVYPVVIGAMREKGIDVSKNKPTLITPEMLDRAELIVTMGCQLEQLCPRPMIASLQKKVLAWDIDDPKNKSITEVRRIRDAIES